MGRGRAKAKQTKVARELKYSTSATDLDRLQRELAGGVDPFGASVTDRPAAADELDPDDLDPADIDAELDDEQGLAR
jgi:hypothetical protein